MRAAFEGGGGFMSATQSSWRGERVIEIEWTNPASVQSTEPGPSDSQPGQRPVCISRPGSPCLAPNRVTRHHNILVFFWELRISKKNRWRTKKMFVWLGIGTFGVYPDKQLGWAQHGMARQSCSEVACPNDAPPCSGIDAAAHYGPARMARAQWVRRGSPAR